HPLGFDEPFGLSVVEAMACGTPVVGYRRGALPETVSEGISGILVDDVDGAVAAVPAAVALDRAGVAETARRRFSADRMVVEYLASYEAMLSGPGAGFRASDPSRGVEFVGRKPAIRWQHGRSDEVDSPTRTV